MLKHRLIYGLLIGIGFAASMAFLPGPLLFLLLTSFALACQVEFYRLAAHGNYRVYNRLGLTLGCLWMAVVYLLAAPPGKPHPNVPGWEGALLIAICFVVLLRALWDPRAVHAFETAAITFLGIFYGPVMLSYFLRLAQWEATSLFATTRGGVFLTFFLAFVIKMSDTGAYGVGMRLGRHKLFPRISPAKSWEGLAGGLLVGVACGVGVALAAGRWHWGPEGIFWAATGSVPAVSPPLAALLAVLLVTVGVLGVLIESMFKRTVHVKDSSGIIPGMGGMLDVVDSLIFAPACVYFFLVWMTK
ncbi:MAG: phosphatidate cytidylyltransferase [Kiritimatiellae bacterium]|nr:phosphatidate cytidylyltransferase [Kiritimatiellia bacterium]